MFWRFVYNTFALPILFIGLHLAARFNRKIREAIVGRRHVFEKLQYQLNDARNLNKTVWFHFTSAGEFEQVKPLIEEIHAETRIVLTFFSPSVAPNVKTYPYVDAALYLPFDTPHNAERLIHLIKPTCLVFSKSDIWPNLVWNVSERSIPIILIAGTLHAGSKRMGKLVRGFFKSVHRHINLHCAISEADAARFRQLCYSEHQVVVTGDTRYDQVYRRAVAVKPDSEFFSGQKTLKGTVFIAGSTYTEDEKVLLDAYQILCEGISDHKLYLIIVPHEPTPKRINEIHTGLDKRKLAYRSFSELNIDENIAEIDVLVVDVLGILAKLYQLADIVFVGGSFHGSVHNVMEPAAMSKPVLFGPTIENSFEASLLLERGAAKIVYTPQEIADSLKEWLTDEEKRTIAGDLAKMVIEENLGAVKRTLVHLRKYM